MRVLKFRAVDLYDRIRIGKQNFSRSFDDARFSRAGWTEKKHRADWPVGRVHAGEEYLVKAAHAANGALLAHDASGKPLFEVLGGSTLLIRIQEDCAHSVVYFV